MVAWTKGVGPNILKLRIKANSTTTKTHQKHHSSPTKPVPYTETNKRRALTAQLKLNFSSPFIR